MDSAEAITKTIEAEAAAAGVTKTSLADAVGINRRNLQARFRGERQWDLDELDTVAHELGLGLFDLFDLARQRQADMEKRKAASGD